MCHCYHHVTGMTLSCRLPLIPIHQHLKQKGKYRRGMLQLQAVG